MHPFSDEVGGALGAGSVGGFEDDSVSKIEHRDFRLIPGPKGREERELGLGGHNGGGVCLPDDVDIRIRLGDKALRLVLPTNEKVVFLDCPLSGRSRVKPAKDVGVKEEL